MAENFVKKINKKNYFRIFNKFLLHINHEFGLYFNITYSCIICRKNYLLFENIRFSSQLMNRKSSKPFLSYIS